MTNLGHLGASSTDARATGTTVSATRTHPSAWPAWHCPEHHRALVSTGSALSCPNAHEFPLRLGIPRFVPTDGYADSFGAQWKRYRLTQLDSYTGTTITEERTRRCLGEELWSSLRDRQLIECGCGSGRFTEVLLRQGAVVTSIDLSAAVEANQENFPQDERHRIAQADIMRLPFAPRQFDVVFCLGVVQHTPDPERTIAALYDHVKPGGALVFDHYTFSLSRATKLATVYRWFIRHLAPAQAIRVTEVLVKLFFPLHRLVRNSRIGRALLGRVSPVATYFHMHPELPDDMQREWALVDTHDSLTDWYKHLRSVTQIRDYMRSLGMTDIWVERGGNGVEARGRRPLETDPSSSGMTR